MIEEARTVLPQPDKPCSQKNELGVVRQQRYSSLSSSHRQLLLLRVFQGVLYVCGSLVNCESSEAFPIARTIRPALTTFEDSGKFLFTLHSLGYHDFEEILGVIRFWTAILLLESSVLFQNGIYGLAYLVPFSFELAHQKSHGGELELTVLDPFAIVVLIDAALTILWATDDNVAQPDIMFLGWCAATNANHQADFDVCEAAEHIRSYSSRGSRTIFSMRQYRDDDLVACHRTKCVCVVIACCNLVWVRLIMFFIEE
ncbi:hypothetical protein KCV07_g340, partial [Aureobasidium melanogenum]